MADNTRGGSQDASDPLIATDEVTYSGDTADVQLVRVVGVTGAEGSKTVVDPTLPVSGDVAHDDVDSGNPVKIGGVASYGVPIIGLDDGKRVEAWFSPEGAQMVIPSDAEGDKLAIDTNGKITAQVEPVPGTAFPIIDNGESITVDNPALTELAAAISTEVQVDVVGALPAGNNNIGDVDIASIAAGDNNIGNVDIASMPGVTGNVAHDDVDSGNPVKVGGKASETQPAFVAEGDRVNAWLGRDGRLFMQVVDDEGHTVSVTGGVGLVDGNSIDGAALHTISSNWIFNGTNWDRLRGDTLGLHVSRQATAATATLSNVASSASSVTLLSLNTARKGASIHNDSTQVLYVKFGTTASATSYTVKMAADAHYEVPFGYTGRIDGIWASANGTARVTEMT